MGQMVDTVHVRGTSTHPSQSEKKQRLLKEEDHQEG
jgi:hypothetical protein